MIRSIPMTRSIPFALLAWLLMAGSPVLAQQEDDAERTDLEQVAPDEDSQSNEAVEAAEASEPAAPAVSDERQVELTELVAQVATIDGREFIIDPRVRGRAYVLPRDDTLTYASLLAILRVHGFLAVPSGERVYVVPDAVGRFMPARLLEDGDDTISNDEIVSHVIDLGGENAQRLVPLLRPLLPQSAHLAATQNKLLIVDRYDNAQRIAAIARALAD